MVECIPDWHTCGILKELLYLEIWFYHFSYDVECGQGHAASFYCYQSKLLTFLKLKCLIIVAKVYFGP